MKKTRKILALLLTAIMILTVPTTAFGTPGGTPKGSFDIVQGWHDEGKGIYKLTATAKTDVASVLAVALSMSYDNTVVQPVDYVGTVVDIANTVEKNYAFNQECGENGPRNAYFRMSDTKWVVDNIKDRTAFTLTMATTNNDNGTPIATGMVVGEFYFKIKDGKSLNKGSFRIETPNYADSQIADLFLDTNEQDAITLGLKTSSGQTTEKLLYGSKMHEDSLTASLTYDNSSEDVVKSLKISGDAKKTIQVPAIGSTNTLDLDATAEGIYGDAISNVEITWSMAEVSGVTMAAVTGVITVDSTAQSSDFIVTATAVGTNITDTANISVQRGGGALAKVVLNQGSIEVQGGKAVDQTITAAAFDQYGGLCSGATWSVSGSDTANVTIDAVGTVTVKSNAMSGDYTVMASKAGSSASAAFKVTHTASIAKSIAILKDGSDCLSDTISKPVSGAAKNVTYTAKVMDQFNEVMANPVVLWTIDGTLPGNVTQSHGTITVPSNAQNGNFNLKAAIGDGSISDTCSITITMINADWSDIKATTAGVIYGAKNSELITGTEKTELKYNLDGTENYSQALKGGYSIKDGGEIQGAGLKTVTVNFTAEASEANGEYKNVVLSKEFSVKIDKKPIAVTVNKKDKIYGSSNPNFDVTCQDTLVGTDKVEDLSLTFDCNADTTTDVGKTTITAISSSANYDVAATDGTLTIKPKKLTIENGSVAITKVYDGTTSAGALTGELSCAPLNNDVINVTASNPTDYSDKNVGAGYSVDFNITLDGTDAANYTLGEEGQARINTATGTLASAAITPRAITISGAVVADKVYVYNGSRDAQITSVDFAGLITGEAMTLGTDYSVANAAFESENVGNDIPVSATVTLKATEKANHYSLANGTLKTKGNIVKSSAEITGIDGSTQVLSSKYDKAAATKYTFDLKTLQIPANDIKNISYGTVAIADNTSGMIKSDPAPTIVGATLSFTVIPKEAGQTANVTVVIKSDNYADSTATITITSIDKVLVSKDITFANGNAIYSGQPQTYEKATASGEGVNTVTNPLKYTYSTSDGKLSEEKPLDVGTYTVKAVYEDESRYGEKTATFTIKKAPLKVTASDNTISYGEKPSAKGVTYSGFVVGETETALSGIPDYDYSYTQYDNAGDSYSITPKGYTAVNYDISYCAGKLTVSPKSLIVEKGTYQVTKAYDGTTAAGTTSGALLLVGIEHNDAVNVHVGTVGTYIDKEASANKSISLSGLTLTGDKSVNYNLSSTAFDLITATITPRTISNVKKGDYAITKEYDGTTAVGTPSGSLDIAGIIAGDEVIVGTTVGTYDSKDVGNTHSVIVTFGDLKGNDSGNYVKDKELTTITITNAAITPADYTYTVGETQEIKEGSTLSAIIVAPKTVTGKNSEKIQVTTKWYQDSGRTVAVTDSVFGSLKADDEITLYWSGTTSDKNYKQAAKTGSTLFNIVEGNTQIFEESFIADVTKTYGDQAYTKTASLTTGTGNITYASSNKDVATVNADTGAVDIHKVGEAKITATAGAVPGEFVETRVSYKLKVDPKEVTLTWSGDNNLVYDNKPKNVAATANDVVQGDTVNVTVTGGNAVNAGTYTAEAAAVSNPNYKLPASAAKSYTIAKAARNFDIEKTSKTLASDELKFTIKVTTGTDLDKSFEPIFKSNKTTVAAVNSDGVVRALGNGQATITVTVGSTDNYSEAAEKNCVVTVCTEPITGITSVVSSTGTDKLVGELDGNTINITGFVSDNSTITVTPALAINVTGKNGAVTSINAGDIDKGGIFTAVFDGKEIEYKIDTTEVEKLSGVTISTTTKSAIVGGDIGDDVKAAVESALEDAETKAENFESAIVKQVVAAANTLGGTVSDVNAWVRLDIEAKAYTTTSMALGITPKLVLEWKEGSDSKTKETKLENLSNLITVSVKLPSGFGIGNLFAKHDLGGGLFEYFKTTVNNGIATWKQGSFSDVTLISDSRIVEVNYKFEDGSQQTASYVASDLGKRLPTDSKTGYSFDGWTIDRKDYTSVTEELLNKGGIQSAAASFIANGNGGNTGGSGGGGGGGGMAPEILYNIELAETVNGTVIIGNGKAVEGAKTTIKATPEIGYVVDKITVTSKDGKGIEVTKNADGTFSFIQPNSNVIVHVKFIERKSGDKIVDENVIAEILSLFNDVSENDWFVEPVAYVVSKGIMTGIFKDQFRPDESMTRGMAAAVIYRMEGSPKAPEEEIFEDVDYSKYYGDGIKWSAQQGIIKGFATKKFQSDWNVVRSEFAQMMYGYAKFLGYDTTIMASDSEMQAFRDYDKIADWSKNAMAFMVGNGLMSGNEQGEINATGVITRSEVAAILSRFLTGYKK